jgi:hypothetical protein
MVVRYLKEYPLGYDVRRSGGGIPAHDGKIWVFSLTCHQGRGWYDSRMETKYGNIVRIHKHPHKDRWYIISDKGPALEGFPSEIHALQFYDEYLKPVPGSF